MSEPMALAGASDAATVWHCELCGFTYDEAQGCPPEGFGPVSYTHLTLPTSDLV